MSITDIVAPVLVLALVIGVVLVKNGLWVLRQERSSLGDEVISIRICAVSAIFTGLILIMSFAVLTISAMT